MCVNGNEDLKEALKKRNPRLYSVILLRYSQLMPYFFQDDILSEPPPTKPAMAEDRWEGKRERGLRSAEWG